MLRRLANAVEVMPSTDVGQLRAAVAFVLEAAAARGGEVWRQAADVLLGRATAKPADW